MSVADKAVWVIERNSDDPLTLNAVAEACGVSRSHLAGAFGSATGVPVIKYLRARRLSEAAKLLASGARNILDVALATGYGSHEAFTRAFREQFSTTPETVRDQGLGGLTLTAPLELRGRRFEPLAPPRFERQSGLKAVGLAGDFTVETVVGIPAQWQAFMVGYDEIAECVEAMPIGLCHPVGEDGRIGYVCAAEVAKFGTTPEGMTRIEIPAGDYAVFEHRGHVSTIFDTYAAIWNEALPATGRTLADGPVIERHNDDFDPTTGEGGVMLWVPVAE